MKQQDLPWAFQQAALFLTLSYLSTWRTDLFRGLPLRVQNMFLYQCILPTIFVRHLSLGHNYN